MCQNPAVRTAPASVGHLQIWNITQNTWSLQQKADFQGRESFTLYTAALAYQREPQAQRRMLAETAGVFAIFCHLLCCPPHIPSLHVRKMWLPVPVPDWSDPPFLPLTLKPVKLTRPWERSDTTSTKPDSPPSQEVAQGQNCTLLLGFWSPALLLNFSRHQLSWMLLKGRSHHSHKAAEHSPNALGCPNLKLWTFFRECSVQLGGRCGGHLLISIQTDKATKEVWVKGKISAEEKNDKPISMLKTAELLK